MWVKGELTDIPKGYRKKVRFLVDEDVREDVIGLLLSDGWNAVGIRDAGLSQRDDQEFFALAKRQNRMIVTHDQGFLDNRRFPYSECPGVIVLPGGSDADVETVYEAVYGVLFVIDNLAKLFDRIKIVVREERVWRMMGWNKQTGEHLEFKIKFKKGRIYTWEDD